MLNRFDDIDKPSKKIVDDCVHCGFCLSACPTYIETGNELDSPRGRIYLMGSVLEEKIPLGDTVVEHLDKCLGCLACETACPSGVEYRFLIEASRAQIERNYKRPLGDKLFRGILFSFLPYPKKLGRMLPLLYLYNKSGMRKVIGSLGILKKLSSSLYRMEQMIPDVESLGIKQYPEVIPPKSDKKHRVALLTGCVQNVFFSPTNVSSINVLSKLGCEVVIPGDQACCGALSVHSGRLEEGREFARKVVDIFSSLDVDAFIINSAGCGSAIKEYSELLSGDRDYSRRAAKLAAKTMDIMEFIEEIGIKNQDFNNLDMKITYQDACHISHGQNIRSAPRNVLSKIPGLEIVEMKNSDTCCGSAGVYNILQPDLAEDILTKKIQNIEKTKAEYVVAGNPGCLIQIQKGLRENKKEIGIAHPIEILDKALK